MILKFLKRIDLKALTVSSLSISLVFFGIALMFNLTLPLVYAGTLNVWNLERNTGNSNLDFYYSTSGPKALSLTTGGNVGIGTTAPASKLDVGPGEIGLGRSAGDIARYSRIGFTDDGTFLSYYTNNSYFTGSQWNYVNPGGYGGVATRLLNNTGAFQFDTANNAANPVTWNTRMYISNGGNVGIGTTTPTQKLFINGSTGQIQETIKSNTVTLDLYANDGFGGYTVIGTSSNHPLLFQSNATERMRIDSTGNVGIGIAAPINLLHLKKDQDGSTFSFIENTSSGTLAQTNLFVANGTTASDTMRVGVMGANFSDAGGYIKDAGVLAAETNLSNGLSIISRAATAPIRFYTGGYANERMRISETGKVGIRTAGPTNDLHIKQSSESWASGGIKLERSDSGVFGSVILGIDNNLSLVSNSGAYYCTVGSTAPIYCSSDRRLKENISPLSGSALDILGLLKPSTFNWKSTGAHSAGFIAQDVKKVLPEAVYDGGDMGLALSDGYFTPYMVKGIQELNDQVKNQQAEIDLLKQEIEELKKLNQ